MAVVADAGMRQALLWREAMAGRLADAIDLLEEAYAGVPVSVERMQLARALNAARDAQSTCMRNAQVARARIS